MRVAFIIIKILSVCVLRIRCYSVRHLGCFTELPSADSAIPSLLTTLSSIDNETAVNQCARYTSLKGYRVFGLRSVSFGTTGCYSGKNAYINYKRFSASNNCLKGIGGNSSNDVYFIAILTLSVKIVDENELFDVRLLQTGHQVHIARSNATRNRIVNATQSLDGVWKIGQIQFRPRFSTGITITTIPVENVNGTDQLDDITSALQHAKNSQASLISVQAVDLQCQFNGASMFVSPDHSSPSKLYCSKSYQLTVKMDPPSCNYTGYMVNTTKAFLVDASNKLTGEGVTLNTTTAPQIFPGELRYATYLIVFRSKMNNSFVKVRNFEFGFVKILPVSPKLSISTSPLQLLPVNPNEHRIITLSAKINYLQGCPPLSESNQSSADVLFYWYCRASYEMSMYIVRDVKSLPYVEQRLNASAHKGGCFGTGPGLLFSTSNMLNLNTSQLTTNAYLAIDVMTIRDDTRIYKTITFQSVLNNISVIDNGGVNGSGLVDFNAAVKLTSVNFTQALHDTCSSEYLKLGETFTNAIYMIYQQQALYRVTNVRVVRFEPGTIVNFTGQVSVNHTDAAVRLLNVTVQSGSLPGNLTVDPVFLRTAQYKHVPGNASCPVHPSNSSRSGLVYFTTGMRLVGLVNQTDLNDRCSHELMDLSSRLVNEVDSLMSRHGYNVTNLQVLYFLPNGSVNCSGQVDRDVSGQAGDLLNSTIQTGRLGNITVDPNYWMFKEHALALPRMKCPNGGVNGSGLVDFNAAVRLTSVNFTQALHDTCSSEYLKLGETFSNAIYMIYQQQALYRVTNFRVVRFEPGTIVNFTGQVSVNHTDAAVRLLNVTVQSGSLPGNLTVDPVFLRTAQYKHVPGNASCRVHQSNSSRSGLVYFTTGMRLVGLVNQTDLNDRCSHELMDLSSRLVNEIYSLMDRHGHKGQVVNLQVLHFLPNGSVNCSGQVDRDFSGQAGDLLNSTIQTGRLGNITVDPNYWMFKEHALGIPFKTCERGSREKQYEKLYCSIKLTSVAFSLSLLNQSSMEFQLLANKVVSLVALLYVHTDGQIPSDWKVIKFEKGSVITHLSANVPQNSSHNIQEIFKSAIRNGSLGNLTVDPTFVIVSNQINETTRSSCPMPDVVIPNVHKSIQNAYKILRSWSVNIKGKVSSITCDAPNTLYVFKWTVTPIDKHGKVNGTEMTLNNRSAHLYLEKNSLHYGFYIVQFNVTRRSTAFKTKIDYGVIQIIATPLVAIIAGGNAVTKGFAHPIILDASRSYDPDVGLYKNDGIVFSWLCRKVDESWPLEDLQTLPVISLTPGSGKGCFGTGIGRLPLQPTQHRITISSGKLAVKKSYLFVVLLSKDSRTKMASQRVHVVPGDPPDTQLRCNANCGPSMNPSSKLSLEVTCPVDCNDKTMFTWTLYIKTWQDVNMVPIWQKMENLQSLLLSSISSPGFVVKPNVLDGGREYRIQVEVLAAGRAETNNEYMFTTNAPPKGGLCSITPQTGEALSTDFVLTCRDWTDPEKPLGYHFRYRKSDGAYAVLYHGKEESVTCKLPTGVKTQDYTVTIEVLISDAFGATNFTTLQVKVAPKQAAPNTTIESTLESLTVGESSAMANLLKTGNVDGATQLANAVLDTIDVDDQQISNNSLSSNTQEKIVTSIIEKMSDIKVDNVETLTQVSSVVATATRNNRILTQDSQDSSLKILGVLTTVLAVKTQDDAQSSDNLDKGAENLYYGIGNIWTAASQDASLTSTNKNNKNKIYTKSSKDQSISMAKQSSQLVKKVSSTLLSRMTAGEKVTVFKTTHISVAIKRNRRYNIGGQKINLENSSLELPNQDILFGSNTYGDSTIIDFQMVYTKKNVYSWSPTSRDVTSSIISFDPLDQHGKEVSFSDLNSTIVMTLPRVNSQDHSNNATVYKPSDGDFLRNNIPMYRKLTVAIPGSLVHIKINLQPSNTMKRIVAITKFGERPTVSNNDYTTKVFQSTSIGVYMLTIPGSVLHKKGTYLVGMFYEEYDFANKRVRRSCADGSGGRQKRSCVEVREAPTTPPPKNITVKPAYDPDRDVKVSMTTDMSSCLYWSTTLEKWTSHGCTAGPESSPTSIQCFCNHLSTFGGNFVVAPNPIDFDVVTLAFTQLDETKNFSVILFTGVLLTLYLIVLVWCRRADKNDKAKVGPHIEINHEPFHTASYEVTIETGVWFGSGTTANVAMTIAGNDNQNQLIAIFHEDFPDRRLFCRGNIDQFIVHSACSLGELVYIRIWHDNSGIDPSWFLRSIQIKDLYGGNMWYFPCNQWLDVLRQDSAIERLLLSQPKAFELNTSIRHKTTESFVEEHLWVSVMARLPLTHFTRVQRITCCLSLLFSAMIANAMFYNISGKTEKTFQIGPLQLSLKQIVIGIQSGLIVAPINILIVQLFKVAGKLRHQEEKDPFDKELMLKRRTSSQQELLNKPMQRRKLSSFLKFVAYLVSLLSVTVSATFTIFYSMQWGNDVSNQWLSSMIISLIQDLFVIQPTKIIIIAIIVTFLVSKCNKQKTAVERLNTDNPMQDTAKIHAVDKERSDFTELISLTQEQKDAQRKKLRKEMRFVSTAKEIFLYLVFVVLLCLVCYGSRTRYGFLINNTLKQTFAQFDQITDDNGLYEWIEDTLISGLYATSWYNNRNVTKNAYISDKQSMLMGMPRLRQLRVQKGHCTIPKEFKSSISRCIASYSFDKEYTTALNYPGWKTPSHNNQTLTPETCPKPWRYHSATEITSLPYWGLQTIYSGGGYVAHLGYDPDIASNVVKELIDTRWLDSKSSAVLIIFSVFNVNTEYASFLSFLYEKLPTGFGLASFKIHSMPLYPANDSFLIFQLLFLLIVAFYSVLIIVKVAKNKCTFLRDYWNIADLVLVVLSVSTVTVQIVKGLYMSHLIQQIQDNPYSDLSFDYVVMATDVEDSLIALLMFVSTLKLIKLIKLDLTIMLLSSSIRISMKDLAPFSIIFTVILLAFAQFGILVFGREDVAFSNVYNALSTELQMFIGGAGDLWALEKKNRVLAKFYILSFMIFMAFILMNIFIAVLAEAQVNQKKQQDALQEETEFLEFIKMKVISFFRYKNTKIDNLQTSSMVSIPDSKTAEKETSSRGKGCDDSVNMIKITPQVLNNSARNQYRPPKTNKHKISAHGQNHWKAKQNKIEYNVLLIHGRVKRMDALLNMLEMDLTNEDMQMTQIVLQLESNTGTSASSTRSSPHLQITKPPSVPEDSRRESTVTLSNVMLTDDFVESEQVLQQVFPLQPLSINSRFKPVVFRQMRINRFVNTLQDISENKDNVSS